MKSLIRSVFTLQTMDRGLRTGRKRGQDSDADYNDRKRPSRSLSNEISIKVLLNGQEVRALMANKAQNKKNIADITKANIYITTLQGEGFYPTSKNDSKYLRVLYVTGTENQVGKTLRYIWNMIRFVKIQKQQGEDDFSKWDSGEVTLKDLDCDEKVFGAFSIPQTAAGLLIGINGATKKMIEENSGATVIIEDEDKEFGDITNERELHITGTLNQCMNATSIIVAQFSENPFQSQFITAGTRYPQNAPDKSSPFLFKSDSLLENVGGSMIVSAKVMRIDNNIIGAVIGAGGTHINHVRTITKANIEISEK